jgi:peptidoglycan/LPS O-acetylase OafA/YrhL
MVSKPSNPTPTGYLPYLDGVRAVSILLVMLFHAGAQFRGVGTVLRGWLGVSMFFVLSGFLITLLLAQEHQRTGGIHLGRFYMRRCLRLMPAYAALLLGMLLWYGPSAARAVAVAGIYLSDYDCALQWDNLGAVNCLGVTWSLAVEEHFYLVWPIVLYLAGSRALRVAVIGVLAAPLWRALVMWLEYHRAAVTETLPNTGRWYYAFDTRLDALMIGCAAALVWADPALRARLRRALEGRWVPGLVAAALLGSIWTIGGDWWEEGIFSWTVLLPVCTALMALAVLVLQVQPTGGPARWLSHPLLTWVGRLSYSLYLWHLFAADLADLLAGFLARHLPGGEYWNKGVMVGVVSLALSFGLASLSYYLIEKPFLRLKKRFESTGPTPAPAVPIPALQPIA